MISVVMPCFNAELVVEKTLQDFANQIYKDFELIIINDGSTDRSELIIKDFISRNGLQWTIISHPNQGVSAARNTGMELAKGDYIVFCDCDDRFENNYLSELYKKSIEDSSDVIFCGYDIKDINNGSRINLDPSSLFFADGKTGTYLFKRFIVKDKNAVQLARILIKAEILSKNNIKFDESFRYGEDYIFMAIVLFYADKASCVHKILYHYVQWNGQSTKQARITLNWHWLRVEMLDGLSSVLKQNNVSPYLLKFIDKIQIPNNTAKDLSQKLRLGRKDLFQKCLKDPRYLNNIRRTQCLFCLLKKPEIWFKGFELLYCPRFFYKYYMNRDED